MKFADAALGGVHYAFPPKLEDLLMWSHTFRCVGTFPNYLGAVQKICLALDIVGPQLKHELQ